MKKVIATSQRSRYKNVGWRTRSIGGVITYHLPMLFSINLHKRDITKGETSMGVLKGLQCVMLRKELFFLKSVSFSRLKSTLI